MTESPRLSSDSSPINNQQSGAADQQSTTNNSLSWQVRLWQHGKDRRLVILVFAMIAGSLGYLMLHAVVGILIGFLAITGFTTDYWLPIQYRLDRNKATMRCGMSITSIEWGLVKHVVEDANGVKLSPLEDSKRLAPFRGVYLRFEGNRDEVMNAVEAFIASTAKDEAEQAASQDGGEAGGPAEAGR